MTDDAGQARDQSRSDEWAAPVALNENVRGILEVSRSGFEASDSLGLDNFVGETEDGSRGNKC
jgi:hypothetical protein